MQLALPNHVESRMIAKMTVQYQVSQMDRALNGVQKALQHFLDTLQLRVEHYVCLVFIATALWTSRFPLWMGRFGLLGFLFRFAGCFFFFCADHLFHTDWIGASLLGANQGQCEKGQPRDRFLPQTGEKVVQTMRLLACFCHDTFITCQQVGVLTVQQMLTKECPEYLRPGYDRVEETLHGPVAAAFFGPTGYP